MKFVVFLENTPQYDKGEIVQLPDEQADAAVKANQAVVCERKRQRSFFERLVRKDEDEPC